MERCKRRGYSCAKGRSFRPAKACEGGRFSGFQMFRADACVVTVGPMRECNERGHIARFSYAALLDGTCLRVIGGTL